MTRLTNMTSEVGKDKIPSHFSSDFHWSDEELVFEDKPDVFANINGDDENKGNTTQNNNHQPSPQQSPRRQPEQLILRRSFRKKKLPPVPKQDAASSPPPGSPPMFERAGISSPGERTPSVANSPNGVGAYGQLFLEYALMAEYNQLQKQRLPGVYVIPSAASPLHWFGVLFIRQGLYQEGVFKFDVHIPDNYPDGDCPRLVFHPPVFHPIVDFETGELDVQRAFKQWRRNVNHIWQVLLYARRIFYKIDTKAPLNPEAAVLYEEDNVLFKAKVADTIATCKSQLYDSPHSDDPHAIRFSKWEEEKHSKALKTIVTPKVDEPEYSFVKGSIVCPIMHLILSNCQCL
ncbi:AKT-interacting protein-like isoform X2 [Amphiura filiformis]|uniref:AKT-interacting protein-like isoform X2 n=1 Tax=Amphiura filiformis TaxID=82378 RepID=UPI003B213F0C